MEPGSGPSVMRMAKSTSVSVYAAGDVFADTADGRAAFAPLEPLFATGDIVFGNSEGIYCDRPAKSPSYKHFMGTSQDRGAFLGEVGFDVMSLANNHMIDGGYVGLQDTADLFRRQGVATFGAGENLAAALKPAVLERRGRHVAFLGASSVFPKGYEARPGRPGIAPLRVTTSYLDPDENFWEPGIEPAVLTTVVPGDFKAVTEAIERAHDVADFVIMAPHWGYSSRLELLHDYELDLGRASSTRAPTRSSAPTITPCGRSSSTTESRSSTGSARSSTTSSPPRSPPRCAPTGTGATAGTPRLSARRSSSRCGRSPRTPERPWWQHSTSAPTAASTSAFTRRRC